MSDMKLHQGSVYQERLQSNLLTIRWFSQADSGGCLTHAGDCQRDQFIQLHA